MACLFGNLDIVKFIYQLQWTNIKTISDKIIVYVPLLEEYVLANPPTTYTEQYHIYHLLQMGNYRREIRIKRDVNKVKYGIY